MTNEGHRLADLAERHGLQLQGDPGQRITGVAPIGRAGPGEMAFLANRKLRAQLASTRAGAVIMDAKTAEGFAGNALIAANPSAAFARIAAEFEDRPLPPPGVHPTAVIAVDAEVDPSASIGPYAVIGARSRVGAGAEIGPHCVIGHDCVVGPHSRLVARVTLVERVRLGARVLVHPGAVLGADGFGLAFEQGAWLKVPQLGGVRIGDDCEIGANTTIDRGALDDTVLEEDVRLDNQIQIAHNVVIGAHSAMAGCSAIAGSAKIGRYCLIGGAAGIAGHIELCDRVTVTAMSLVSHSIREPGEYSSGIPVQESRRWRRNAARIHRLDRLVRQLDSKDKDDPT
ncbi:UDP-3-O-(3-hydroxymyristoyl)glucosamine N-acyltransferase [Pseudofulvimonas gallinarii]|jgi:UDP-3-O-[3-hydroxymyristoyl] glucosamine N-acyltransferase|nr:UDP-3-O-(3-hydroxymyristoyl)glucosamine N-acyltransferase [Pseudofulvimonas gallinarii]THD13589.1 UDP-3-O-(3-hydroxymyristoyl)glucosamine N-acyltransferase [Pseudofulvimonas gallinarii]